MGFFDYVSDLYSSLSIQDAYADDRQAEARQFEGPVDTSGEQSDGKDVARGGMGTAHQRGGAGVQGGVSTKTPASGTDEESESEKEANEGTASSAKGRSSGEADKGHSPGEGGAASGQRAGAHEAGPYGGPVKAAAKDEDEEEEEEEEEDEEEDDEPVDPKQQLEEECMRSQQCAPLKHHYDECAERVQHQQEENGKADEDCVEEFFHLMHCASQCAAPKLFKQLR